MASPRQSALASRHLALGADLGDWNDMDVALEYDQDMHIEHRAVREKAGLFDVSGLRKIHVTGPDAFDVLNYLCTRDLSLLYPGKSSYGLILDDKGGIADDCIIFNMRPNSYMMVHGAGNGFDLLKKSAEGKDVAIEFDDDLHNISLQGPAAVDFLDEHTTTDLQQLKYFHHVPTTVCGHDCLISRTGYSGERGYEMFVKADVVGDIWDNLLDKGKSHGIVHCSFGCLDMLRTEAALMFYPYDMNEDTTPWEVNLGFAVSKKKQADFRGKDAVMALRGKEKVKTIGLIVDTDSAVGEEAEVLADGEKIGTVTIAMYSTLANESRAMAHVEPKYATPDIDLEVRDSDGTYKAKTHGLPIHDPKKIKREG